ncbi:MAG: sigma-70 family RNA polymerase sigma factor [Blastocatellia bacterium]|nr:sigma-70 family RNA polymerase sigma factor [Blastocatellia bacterium]MCX7752202.1 sigma-70 family RNA polymerase sigma factor [Blastocatellia bacterium]MDW8167694.1 sigma-70 family RNA polymerase sigma factor [Acidobacteriota bacterium]MDW8256293.1 sigma-70 family RNA polymerase sigma factor [Acidobacteriota bacterium]
MERYALLIECADAEQLETVGDSFVERLRAGEREAFEQLVMRFQADVYGLLHRLLGDSEEARDATQETFLKVYRHIGRFRGECELKTWIYRIAINHATNRHRWWRRNGDRLVSMESLREGMELPLSETLADPRADPEQQAIAREEERLLVEALGRIKPIFRTAVLLRDVEGLSYEEIAAMLQVSVGTVKSRIARGREALRQQLHRLQDRHGGWRAQGMEPRARTD